jgi:hypothetical protein
MTLGFPLRHFAAFRAYLFRRRAPSSNGNWAGSGLGDNLRCRILRCTLCSCITGYLPSKGFRARGWRLSEAFGTQLPPSPRLKARWGLGGSSPCLPSGELADICYFTFRGSSPKMTRRPKRGHACKFDFHFRGSPPEVTPKRTRLNLGSKISRLK